jgi:hypothetical protein
VPIRSQNELAVTDVGSSQQAGSLENNLIKVQTAKPAKFEKMLEWALIVWYSSHGNHCPCVGKAIRHHQANIDTASRAGSIKAGGMVARGLFFLH